MNYPQELWYGLGGLVLALIAQRLRLPWGGKVPKSPDELREFVKQILWEVLQPPAPSPGKGIDDESIRKKLVEMVNPPKA